MDLCVNIWSSVVPFAGDYRTVRRYSLGRGSISLGTDFDQLKPHPIFCSIGCKCVRLYVRVCAHVCGGCACACGSVLYVHMCVLVCMCMCAKVVLV